MHRLYPLLISFLVFAPALAFAEPAPLITLSANMEQPFCREGQPVVLALALHSNGIEDYVVGGSAFEESSFHIAVTDEAGQAVPQTALGERVLTPPSSVSMNILETLAPGQALPYRFNLAHLFDLSRAGTYIVSVSRVLRDQITLTAPPLKVHLVEAATMYSGKTALSSTPGRSAFFYIADENYTRWTAEGKYITTASVVECYRVGPDGGVYSTLNVPVSVDKGTGSIVATPDGRFLYVGNETSIAQFQVGADGVLSPLSPPTVVSQSLPGPLLMDPRGRFLCVSSQQGTAVYAVGHAGCLTATLTVPFKEWGKHQNASVVPGGNGVLDSTGTFFYASNGATIGYRLDSTGHVIIALGSQHIEEQQFDAGVSLGQPSTAIALTPSGRFAYVIGEKQVGQPANITGSSEDLLIPMRVKPDGSLEPLTDPLIPRSPNGDAYGCTDLRVDPTGHVLLVLNSMLDYIAPYRINPDGSLTALKITSLAGSPLMLFFVPGSPLVYVSSLNTGGLLAFQLNAQAGLAPAAVDTLIYGLPYAKSVAAVVAPTPPKRGLTTSGVQMSLWLAGDVQSAGKPVVLMVILKNVTKHSIRLGATGKDVSSFRLAVIGPQRQSPGVLRGGGEPLAAAAPLLAAGHDLLDAPGPSTVPVILPPGGQRQYRFVLSRFADLTVAGNYTVQITRILPGGAVVASPVVPFLLDGPFNGRVRDDKYSVQIL